MGFDIEGTLNNDNKISDKTNVQVSEYVNS